jgi:hypothetical protein
MMFGATPPPLGRPEAMAISDKERCSNLLIREQRIIPYWGASRSASAVSAQEDRASGATATTPPVNQ